MKYEHRYLFVEILEGVLLVMLGVATMLRTEQVLDSLTLIFGILAVITGLADVMFYIRLERHTGFRPAVSLVSSILSIMLGCALIAHPNVGTGIMLIIDPVMSAATLGAILGIDLILLGIEAVVFAIDCYCRLK